MNQSKNWRYDPVTDATFDRMWQVLSEILLGLRPWPVEVYTERQRYHGMYCLRGHEFTPENTRIIGGGRWRCRECDRCYVRRQCAIVGRFEPD